MAHALRRISYATCEPQHAQFSFLAREPRAHFTIQYCHSFITESSEQAEELNTIVGNAFRMAYVAQLQRQPIIQDVITTNSTTIYQKDKQEQKNIRNKPLGDSTNDTIIVGGCGGGKVAVGGGVGGGGGKSQSTNSWLKSRGSPTSRAGSGNATADMNVQLGSAGSPTLRLASVKTPNSIPGLRPAHAFSNVLGPLTTNQDDPKSISQQSTPSSDESNSPTELNSYKRLTDKPPLIKRLTMGLTGGVLGLNSEDDSCPLVSGSSTPTSPSNRPHSGGYINEAIIDSDSGRMNYNKIPPSENIDNTINASITTKNFNIENNRIGNNLPSSGGDTDFKNKRRSQISTSSSSVPADGSTHGSTPTPTPPPLPERTDSLNNRCEEGELRKAPWFQAGIPREITLEVLSQEPEGAFMVRESTSKPGCYALSLRVPREFQPSGIAHYLIMRTNKGYKIKGFTKEFTTLTALITHHSVMPELLPCPLSLSRYNPSFVKTDSNKDFADIDSDPDYNTLADFRKMMADLNV
ncbi:hypothetical protein PV328_008147 [Microctonus aethiopoides]|uniref:SH2 domain-containing protein n=1 Tax=Microctonus aethiopoides TaxID=144406 RepID=A0AA39CA69_9HYME|nr:hypothetical protein PV328_008147 [Microctonus aethiopoides]